MLAACPGRTWFDAIVEGWNDQGMLRLHLESLHKMELARAARPPALEVTLADPAAGITKYLVNPEDRTVTFTLTGPHPVLQGTKVDDTLP
jgi:hypothetical protein